MNLIACANCGIVYDADMLIFPRTIEREDGSIRTDLAVWDWESDTFRAKVDCRACGRPMPQP